MKVSKNQVFNLMDTNGRRNDVINAIHSYLSILNDLVNNQQMTWQRMPISFAQYEFYKRAVETSPEVFKQHGPYDKLLSEIGKEPDLLSQLQNHNLYWIQSHKSDYDCIIKMFDKGIEDRARHYTSNLVKLGLADSERNISDVGRMLLGLASINIDDLEKLLPLNEVNISYLRQLLKLRIFADDEKSYYSPFCMALLALKRRKRISTSEFLEMIQGLNPYFILNDVESFIDSYREGDIVKDFVVNIPVDLNCQVQMEYGIFCKHFSNQKSSTTILVYYRFYAAFYKFAESRSQADLDDLLTIYKTEKTKINKAFGIGGNVFSVKNGVRPLVDDFVDEYSDLFSNQNINAMMYVRFCKSKQLDIIREYSDTTIRIFKATGIISFDGGYVELAYSDLLEAILKDDALKKNIMGNLEDELSQYYDCYSEYEGSLNSYYLKNYSLSEIFEYDPDCVINIIQSIKDEYDVADTDSIKKLIAQKRKDEFNKYIEENYPEERVIELLSKFSDRSNDDEIKASVSDSATVPTIYEYVVGLAWYYFSGATIDLLSSFNLTLSANFEPITHAGGGKGDIVICDDEKVIMLEATLMNANSQKRGEWEPVLRHSVNLKVEEESSTNRDVTTFFIADEFDANTINIWKAVSSVPLQSTFDKDKFTSNVIIMPINNAELCKLIGRKNEYKEIIQRIRSLFINENIDFDLEWRDKYISTLI